MKFNYDCIHCHINQGLKVAKEMNLAKDTEESILRKILTFVSQADYTIPNPILITTTWEIITEGCGNADPYKAFKSEYDQIMMVLEPALKSVIESVDREQDDQSEDKVPALFKNYLYGAILGNIIDMSPSHVFETDDWLGVFKEGLKERELAIDDTRDLFTTLQTAQKLMYLGDNSGEIILDKLFIAYLQSQFPALEIIFTVRDKAILNDSLMENAEEVGLTKMVKVISNGDKIPSTILERTSDEFKAAFSQADVIIAKGQGNYEGLNELGDQRIYHLLMTKCHLISGLLKTPGMSKVCYKQK